MKSTGYIIELLIAGAGTVLWMGLLLVAIFGMDWIPMDLMMEPGILIVLSPFIYAIGVITDRTVDDFFDARFKENDKNPKFLSKEAYFKARTRIFLASEALTEHMHYNKLRIRICRAWAVNASLIAIAANIWLLLPHTPILSTMGRWQAGIATSLILGSSAWLAFRAWRKLSEKEANYLRHQAQILEKLDNRTPSNPDTASVSPSTDSKPG